MAIRTNSKLKEKEIKTVLLDKLVELKVLSLPVVVHNADQASGGRIGKSMLFPPTKDGRLY